MERSRKLRQDRERSLTFGILVTRVIEKYPMSTETIASPPRPDLIIGRTSAHVYELFKNKLPRDVTYHSYEHTVETAKAAEKIGREEGLSESDLTLVILAAWFHDTGFIEGADNHEERSARRAREFLSGQGLPEDQIGKVERLILSTKPDYKPKNLREKVLHDADIVHIGKKKKFFRYSERLRKELEEREGREFNDQEWAEVQLDFLMRTDFATKYARENYGAKRARNLKVVQGKLAESLNDQKEIPSAEEDKKNPSRGIETMFRTSYRNHINLSSIADSKANIMISVNAILMSIIVSFVSTRLQQDQWLVIPATCMLVTSLAAIIFAILAARPKVTSEVFTIEDVRRNRANILFFGNFVNMEVGEFRTAMHEIMEDWDTLYDTMINDVYSLGRVLKQKYHLLWLSYTVFMGGLIVTVVVFMMLLFEIGFAFG